MTKDDWHTIRTLVLPPLIGSAMLWSGVALAAYHWDTNGQHTAITATNASQPAIPCEPPPAKACASKPVTGPAPTAC